MTPIADVCLILEGTYPYVAGGVSKWVHDLIQAHPSLTFHLLTLMAPGTFPRRYDPPPNVIGETRITLGELPQGPPSCPGLASRLESPLIDLESTGSLESLGRVIGALRRSPPPGANALLNSRDAWRLIQTMYEQGHASCPFLEYFWGWRALYGGLFSVLLGKLPRARIYHTACTGYAGVAAARAHLETARPVVLTEHGIYTSERRIEIMMADWLRDPAFAGYSLNAESSGIREFWTGLFSSYARVCYQASSRVITLYGGNQSQQLAGGADPARLAVIPNGIPCPDADTVRNRPHSRPVVALIGRVVPIKDVKTFLAACALLARAIPHARALVLGPTDEDPGYFEQCRSMAAHLGLEAMVEFCGQVRLEDYFHKIDLLVLTSISEAQPLVILEAAAQGIPAVTTRVGACPEMILGRPSENPPLGEAGIVTPLANPAATAGAMVRLLTDTTFYARASLAARRRVEMYYNKPALDAAYGDLYAELREAA